MLANKTTLIVGAGASVKLGYPTGATLRDWIIEGRGIDHDYREEGKRDRKKLSWRLRDSLIPSIDAFLAEKENEDLREWGIICIAAALLPSEAESVGKSPDWLRVVFDAVRGHPTDERLHPLKIVTFNYDLSIEYFLYRAFLAAYRLDADAAREMFLKSVEIIHVYGQLGKLTELGGDRVYGDTIQQGAIFSASKDLKIIGREPDNKAFDAAHSAIEEAEFLCILGFGYDQTNVANLRLPELTKGKYLFSTGWEMGVGMRAWIQQLGVNNVLFGMPDDNVEKFLLKSALFQWVNTTGATAEQMFSAIYQQPRRLPTY